mgnify:CR=1 FL=1
MLDRDTPMAATATQPTKAAYMTVLRFQAAGLGHHPPAGDQIHFGYKNSRPPPILYDLIHRYTMEEFYCKRFVLASF